MNKYQRWSDVQAKELASADLFTLMRALEDSMESQCKALEELERLQLPIQETTRALEITCITYRWVVASALYKRRLQDPSATAKARSGPTSILVRTWRFVNDLMECLLGKLNW